MLVPPRNPKVDKLVDTPMIIYAYGIIGVLQTGISYFAFYKVTVHLGLITLRTDMYEQVFDFYGVTFSDLAKSDNQYFISAPDDDFTAENGERYSVNDQKRILAIAQGSFYLSIVICQAVHVFACRTRVQSLFTHGFFANKYTNYGVVAAICMGVFVVYTPGLQYITLTFNPHSLPMLYVALIACGTILTYTELSKYWFRKYPTSVVTKWLKW
jgi:magnesium-transporting ATPase (P-type)